MDEYNHEDIVHNFKKETEVIEGGELSSELAQGRTILAFINSLNILGMRNNVNIIFKLSILDTLWQNLKVHANEETIKEANSILIELSEPRRKYAKSIEKQVIPRKKNYTILLNLISVYDSLLRKEADKQTNPKGGKNS